MDERLSTIEQRLDPARVALVAIDLQKDFCARGGHFDRHDRDLEQITAMLPRLAAFLNEARAAEVTIVHVQQTTLPDGASDSPAWRYLKTRDGKSPDYTVLGTWGHDFVAEAMPLDGEPVVRKHRSSGFHGTTLDKTLRDDDIETVVCVGVTTQGCVDSTARDAGFHDYVAVIVEDCVASTSLRLHEAALEIQRSRADVLTAERVIASWREFDAHAQASRRGAK